MESGEGTVRWPHWPACFSVGIWAFLFLQPNDKAVSRAQAEELGSFLNWWKLPSSFMTWHEGMNLCDPSDCTTNAYGKGRSISKGKEDWRLLCSNLAYITKDLMLSLLSKGPAVIKHLLALLPLCVTFLPTQPAVICKYVQFCHTAHMLLSPHPVRLEVRA